MSTNHTKEIYFGPFEVAGEVRLTPPSLTYFGAAIKSIQLISLYLYLYLYLIS